MPVFSESAIFVGTVLAINYLIEPPVEWVARLIAGHERTLKSAVLAIAVFTISFWASVYAAPYVGRLTMMIGETIK